MPISRCIASLFRHLMQYMMGDRSEDHMAAISVNATFILHFEEMIKRGVLPPTLLDMPLYRPKSELEYTLEVDDAPAEPEKTQLYYIPKFPDSLLGNEDAEHAVKRIIATGESPCESCAFGDKLDEYPCHKCTLHNDTPRRNCETCVYHGRDKTRFPCNLCHEGIDHHTPHK